VVLLADSRRAVVDPAGVERRLVERVDHAAVGAGECEMGAGAERLALRDPELGLVLVGAEAGRLPLVERHHDPVPERRERALVERTARRVVLHVDPDVVEHPALPSQ
jgi:hypothetical protein